MYTLLSRPMVYTPFCAFPKDIVYSIALFGSVTLGSGDRPREEGCIRGAYGGGVYFFFPCHTDTRLHSATETTMLPITCELKWLGVGISDGWHFVHSRPRDKRQLPKMKVAATQIAVMNIADFVHRTVFPLFCWTMSVMHTTVLQQCHLTKRVAFWPLLLFIVLPQWFQYEVTRELPPRVTVL